MKVHGIRCKKCEDIIFSRTLHDCRSCTCGAIFIDGGFDYTRIGGCIDNVVDVVELEVKLTKKDLYNDWNLRNNKYGLIEKGDILKHEEIESKSERYKKC